jgi:hypothetical protein
MINEKSYYLLEFCYIVVNYGKLYNIYGLH